MRDDLAPHNDVEGPDDGGPPLPLYGDLARLEDAVQRLQQTLEEHDDLPLWEPMRATQDAVTLAQRLLRGWQVEQAVTQACLTRWQQTLQALETAGVTMHRGGPFWRGWASWAWWPWACGAPPRRPASCRRGRRSGRSPRSRSPCDPPRSPPGRCRTRRGRRRRRTPLWGMVRRPV